MATDNNTQPHVTREMVEAAADALAVAAEAMAMAGHGPRVIKDLRDLAAGREERSGVRDIISDADLSRAHGDADFGSLSMREVVNQGVLKCASGYHQGATARAILEEHGLTNERYELTPKGRAYLWAAFGT